jgi:hypothetical protein
MALNNFDAELSRLTRESAGRYFPFTTQYCLPT